VLLEEFEVIGDVTRFFVVWLDGSLSGALELAGDHFFEVAVIAEKMAGEEFALGEVYIITCRLFVFGLDEGKGGEAVAGADVVLVDFVFPVVLSMRTERSEDEAGNRENGEAAEHE
jgi:hypothetical protein